MRMASPVYRLLASHTLSVTCVALLVNCLVIDNRIELPGDVSLKVSQDAGELLEVERRQLDVASGQLEFLQDFGDQIQSPLGPAVP